MNIANEIVSDTILFGGFEKYRNVPVDDKHNLFTGLDKAAWLWIKKHEAKHGHPPTLDIFREQFPEVTYRVQTDGAYKDTTELVELALEKINANGVAETITKVIKSHDAGNIDQATQIMRDFVTEKDKTATSALRTVNADDLDDLPDPVFLIEDLIQAGTLNHLTGFWGTGKSFLALDLALCAATGKSWFDHKVRAGSVVYVAAEGGTGIKRRVRAWKNRYGYDSTSSLTVVLQPVQLASPGDRADLVQLVKDTKAEFVVIDTQAQCAIGLEENSTKDMGPFLKGLYALRDAVEAEKTTVLVVHHSGYEKSRGRGSTSVPAAMDGIFNVESSDPTVSIKVEHQKAKDSAKHPDICLRLEGSGASMVIAESDVIETDKEKGTERIAVLNMLEKADDGVTSPEVQKTLGMSQTKAQRILTGLVKELPPLVAVNGKRGQSFVYVKLVS